MQKPAFCEADGAGRQTPPEPHAGAPLGVHALTVSDQGEWRLAVPPDAVHAAPVGVDSPTWK
jgi:hypothetical protein